MLLIEVAETSLAYDRSTKLRMYPEADVQEYWVLDCASESVEVHRAPEAAGYRHVARFTGNASISPLSVRDVRVALPEIFA
jgi:Uma2 family endonuclease